MKQKIPRVKIKLTAFLLSLLFLLITALSVVSVTRTISSDGDDIDTFIRNSNGKYWETTETNLQAAIDDLTGGGSVWLPNCNITITNSIELDDNINLIGMGRNSTLYLASGTNKDLIQIKGKQNIVMEKIHLDINGNQQTIYDVKGIDITGSSRDITIRGCYLTRGSSSLIDIQEGAEYIIIENCFFDGRKKQNYGGAIWISGFQCIIKNNIIRDTYACGIVMEAATLSPSAKWNIIDGNEITGEISHGIHMEGAASQSYPKSCNTTVTNNHIHDLYSAAFYASEGHWSRGMIVDDNTVVSNNIISNVEQYGITSTGNVTISNNIIKGVTTYSGIRSWGGNSIITDNVIVNVGTYGIKGGYIVSNNIIQNPADTAIADAEIISNNYIMDATVAIGGALSDSMITNNKIIGSGYAGIDLSGDSDVTVSNNYLKSCGTAIRLSSSADCIISENRITDSTYSIRELSSADYNIISSNNCRGNSNSIVIIGSHTLYDTNNNFDS